MIQINLITFNWFFKTLLMIFDTKPGLHGNKGQHHFG